MLLVSEIELFFEVYAQSQPCYRIFMPGRGALLQQALA